MHLGRSRTVVQSGPMALIQHAYAAARWRWGTVAAPAAVLSLAFLQQAAERTRNLGLGPCFDHGLGPGYPQSLAGAAPAAAPERTGGLGFHHGLRPGNSESLPGWPAGDVPGDVPKDSAIHHPCHQSR